VVRYWRANGLKPSTIAVYVRWVRCFSETHGAHADAETALVHRAAVLAFARAYALSRGISVQGAQEAACCALHAWSMALGALGVVGSLWVPSREAPAPVDPLGQAFAAHQRQHRGLTERSILKQLRHAWSWRGFLHRRRRTVADATLRDVDAFVTACTERYTRTTVADICSSLRAFLRFLRATGRRRDDLAASVVAPVVRRGARLPRALPWSDVRRLLRGVDQSTRVGRRDFAMLLLMATYGMGAAEVTALTLDDIDWRGGTLRILRPKTGAPIEVPLLPPVAHALVRYLRQGRPRVTHARQIFVRLRAPYTALGSSSAVRHIIGTHARGAGISAPYLGSHVLRHSHATRQINAGAPVTVVAHILGHRRPDSTSTYARVALDRLRAMALPVPSWR
jgi:site-specific recombinase XerD